ncbi:MAG: serine hydrolase domain-containing protein [Methyloceanibacter sp.]
MAIMVDRGKLRWDDRVVDLDPDFQLNDPWVTREFRVFDLLAQRSGLPPYVNDMLGILDFNEAALIRSLRHVEPVSSFRSTFAYTNITHFAAGRIVAKAAGTADWNTVLRQELLDPLGMKDSSYTAEAIKAATNRAEGYRWTPNGTIEVPFTQVIPYDYGGAGDINSTVEDMARWVRLQLGNGTFEGRRIVSSENLAFTHTPKVAISDKVFYALGWLIQQTPNGNIIWQRGASAPLSAWCLTRMSASSSSRMSSTWVFRMRSGYGLWTVFLTIPKSTTWRTRSRRRKPSSRPKPSCRSAAVPAARTVDRQFRQPELRQSGGVAGRRYAGDGDFYWRQAQALPGWSTSAAAARCIWSVAA